MRIFSWNINGFRSVLKKGFLDWLDQVQPDILCLQETRIATDQVGSFLKSPEEYRTYWNESKHKKGYSGVSVWTKTEPISVDYGFGISCYDDEGRILILEYPKFTLLNIYFPNGGMNEERLQYKLAFYDQTLKYCEMLKKKGRRLIVAGDYNTAHKEIDLKRPKENENISGFLPIEKEWLDKWVAHGYIDTFRLFHPGPDQYTWWSMRAWARKRNVGWRIDYHFVSEELKDSVQDSKIHQDVMGSDHCPIELILMI